jgi:acetyltransferase-like isoleucine patch superfamily enzyme
MNIRKKIREGKGPFWGTLNWTARKVLTFHIPVIGPTRLLFKLFYLLHICIRDTWIWFTRFFWFEPLFRSQCESIGSGFQMESLPYMQGKGRIHIGDNVRLSGKPSFSFNNHFSHLPELIIGNGTFIGHGSSISIAKSVSIGEHCLIAGGVRIYDLDGHPLDATTRRTGETSAEEAIRPVKIGNDVWIGSGAIILKGISIGDRSIVGAASIVTKDIPPDVVVAGNPATIVRYLKKPEPEEVPQEPAELATTSP